MTSYTLDSSVVIKWFSPYNEDDLEKALFLRNGIKEGVCSIFVPDLLFYEISNALRYNPHFTESDVKDALQSIYDMELNIIRVEKDLLYKAIEIAFNFKVAVYDAVFIATAKKLNNIFLTADYKFYDRIKDFKEVIRLSSLNINANNFI